MANGTGTCVTDFDCVGAGKVCYSNVTWEVPSFASDKCLCSTWYGWEGDDCSKLGSTAIFALITDGIVLVIATFLGAVLWWDVLKMVLFYKSKLRLTSTFLTLISTVLGLNCLFFFRGVLIAMTLTPQHAYEKYSFSEEKLSELNLYVRPLIFFTEFFAVIACLNVSVMWIELAYRAKNMKARALDSVTYYRRAVFAFQFLFFLVMGSLAFLGLFGYSAVAALPFILIIAVTFIIGRYRMIGILQEALASSSGKESSSKQPELTKGTSFFGRSKKGPKDMLQKTRRAMLAIKRVSGHVIASLLCLLISAVGYFLVEALPAAGWKENAKYGQLNTVIIFQQGVSLSLMYAFGAIAHYTHRACKKLYRRGETSTFASSSPSEMSKDETYNSPSVAQISTRRVSFDGVKPPSEPNVYSPDGATDD